MFHSDDQPLPMTEAALARDGAAAPLRAWWDAHVALHGELPSRQDLPREDDAPPLAQAFLAEGLGVSVLRIRMAGHALAPLQSIPLEGLPLSCLFLPEARSVLAEAAMLVLAGQASVQLSLQSEPRLLRPSLRGQLILLPIRPNRVELHPCEVMGIFSPELTMGSAMRRFTITGVEASAIAPMGGRRLSQLLPEYPARPVLVSERKDLPPRLPRPAGNARRCHLRLAHSTQ